jgi:ribosomal protein S18 acetylase RimI-like enzyme
MTESAAHDSGTETQDTQTQDTGVRIRPFRPGDLAGVMALAHRLTEWVPTWRDPAAVLAAVRGWVSGAAAKASEDDHGFYVAEAAASEQRPGKIVGLVAVSEQAHFSGQVDAYVGELVVARGWEHRGIGGRLMRAAEDWAAARGLPFISLDTGADNAPARALYTSLGFSTEAVRLTKPVGQPAA